MDEITRIADRATILRDGRHVITAPMAELTLDKIIEYIVGHGDREASPTSARSTQRAARRLLEARNLSGPRKPVICKPLLHAGEVVGVAGLLGSGRSALARVLFGIDPARPRGDSDQRRSGPRSPSPSTRSRMGSPSSQKIGCGKGSCSNISVETNMSLSILDRLATWAFLSSARAYEAADRQIAGLRIKTPSREALCARSREAISRKW